ncbi:MAG TPA: winged helix DNA-binding domain-containing protein [Candidatus Dormibacteraeota bacterium]|nr:winged helix DNA-binding domain-containing protein [Candidatus Dormibacteraeota bacterium]
MTAEGIALRRLAAQRLVGQPLASAPEVVRHLVAVQSQDYAAAKWGLAQRMVGATDADLDRLFDTGAFFRLHAVRPTWHFVAPEDLRWVLALTGPRVHQASAHQYRQVEIHRPLARRAADVYERVLAGGLAMTKEELGRHLDEAGIPASGLRLIYLLLHAEAEAILCSGPRRNGKQTLALVEERVPPAPTRTRDEALAELARRYVAGHGPAQAADLAWWSGLTLADARRGLATASPALDRETIEGRTFWFADGDTGRAAGRAGEPARTIHLLPNYDELLVAFRDRSDGLDPALPSPARAADEILSHSIVRDGKVVGRWRRTVDNGTVRVGLDRRAPLDAEAESLLASAVERYAAFLGRPVAVTGFD